MVLPPGRPLPSWLAALMALAVLAARPCRGSERAVADDEVSLMQRSSQPSEEEGRLELGTDRAAVQQNDSVSRAVGAKPEALADSLREALADWGKLGNATEGPNPASGLAQRWNGLGQSAVLCPILFVLVGLVSAVLIATAVLSRGGEHFFENLSDDEIEKVFKKIDKDGSGTLSLEEVRIYFKSNGRAIPDSQISAIMKMADRNDNGDLDFEEFSMLVKELGDEQPRDLRRCLIAEFVGMFLFQFFGGMPDAGGSGNAMIGVALLYLFAPISGAHLNPAVTVAAWMAKQVSTKKAVYYLIVEMLSAVQAVLLLRLIGIEQVSSISGVAVNPCLAPAPGIPAWKVLVLETMGTFAFVMVFLAVAVDAKSGWGNAGPLALGITIMGLNKSVGKVSGLSMNPSRFLAPCIVYGCFPTFWDSVSYIAAALIAAALAARLYLAVFLDRPTPEQHVGMSNFQFMIADNSRLKRMLAGKRRPSSMQQPGSDMDSRRSTLHSAPTPRNPP